MPRCRVALAAVLGFSLLGSLAHAEWPSDPGLTGLQVSPNSFGHSDNLDGRSTVPDGTGGAYVGIAQYFGGTNIDGIYIQRVDGQGGLPWGVWGVAISNVHRIGSYAYVPLVAADGSGGVFSLFYYADYPGLTYELAVTHRGSTGASLWHSQSVAVAPGSSSYPYWVGNDGTGGCIAVWMDFSTSLYLAQKLDGAGSRLWGTGGASLGIPTATEARFVSDGNGGLIAFWSESLFVDYNIYAQRYGPGGTPLWPAGGVEVCAAPGDQGRGTWPGIVTVADGAGGACVAWVDRRNDSTGDLYAQRISATGSLLWASGGVAVSAVSGPQEHPAAVADGTGGACFAWEDQRVGAAGIDLYAQRIDGWGIARWAADGVGVSTAGGDQTALSADADANSGIFVAWRDARDPGTDVYAQHLDGSGVIRGNPTGNLVGTNTGNQQNPDVVSDGAGGATTVWQSGLSIRARNVPAADLQVGVEGTVTAFALRGAVPNPTTGAGAIWFSLAERGPVRLELLDVAGRMVWAHDQDLGPGTHVAHVGKMPPGLYLVRLTHRQQSAATKVVFLP